jgi:hypothetical protein
VIRAQSAAVAITLAPVRDGSHPIAPLI